MSSLLFVFAVSMLCIVTGFPSDRFRKDVTYSKCENTYDQCNEWKLNGLCNMNNYKEYMTMQCPVACGLCQQDADGKLEPSRDTSSSSITQSYNAAQAQSAIPQTSDGGYPNAQVAANSQYNPVADSAPYVPPAAANPDVPGTVEKQSDVTSANSQFNSNLLKSVANKDMVSELRKVSMDKVVTEEINEGTNENDVSSSKHIEKEKLNDTNEMDVKQQRLEVKHEPKTKTKHVKKAYEMSHEGSGFHPGSSGDSSGGRPVEPLPEDLSYGESGSGSGGVDFDENFDELIDLVGEGIDDDLEPEDIRFSSARTKSESRLSSTGGETFMSRSNIATPDSEESEESESESGSGSAEESNENDQSDASTEKEEAKEQQTSTTETQVPHKAPEEDEKAEKYEDSEEEDNDESLQATKDSEKDYKKANQNKDTSSEKQNLLGKLVDSGKLKAYAVKKEKSHEVKEEENTQGDERSLSAADIVQGISSSGSGESGSGEEPNSLQVILKQSYDSKYGNVNTPAFQILAGNFENDVEEALGGDSEVSDIAFSEAEIEGNPRVIGKVKVTFKFKGDYQKLQKLVDTGNINGMLVVKNSLEGSIFNH